MSYDEETSQAQHHNDTTPSATSISSSSTVATTPSDTTGPTVDSLLNRQTKSDPEPSHDSTINASEGGIEPGVPEGRENNADPLEGGEQRAQENKHDYAVGALADAVEGLHVASDTESVGGIDSLVSTSGSSSSVAASSLSAPTNPSRSPAHQHHPKHSHNNNNTGNHHQKRRDFAPQRHSPMMVPYTPPSPYAYPSSLPSPQTYMPPGMVPTAPTGAYYPQYYVPPPPGSYYYDPSAAAAAAAGVSPTSYLRPPHRPSLPNAIPTAYNMQPYGYPGIPTTPQGTPPISSIPPPLPLQPGTTYSPMNPTTVAGAARSPRYPHPQLPPPVPTMAQPNFAGAAAAPPVFYDPQLQMQYPSTHLTIYPRPPPSPSVLPVTIPPQSQLRPPSGPIPIPIPATGDPNMFAYPRPPHSPLQAPALSPGAPSPALPPRISGIRPILAPPGQQPPTLLAPFPTQSLSSQHPKPRNPDNAMWVGNLPSNTGPEDLRDFFWEDDFESVYHIAKTHCAFVNYRTYDAVLRAVSKFHDKEYKGIRLVCRPRKQTTSTSSSGPHPRSSTSTTISGSVPLLPHPPTPSSSSSSLLSSPRYHPATTTAPPTPEPSSTLSSSLHADTLTPIRGGQRRPSLPLRVKRSIQDMSVSPQRSPRILPHPDGAGGGQHAAQRFFILKSLTNEDLDISVKSGVWATQPHNEPGLNRAFKNTETVYLIFSANKSGEFYGFARMTSAIIPNRAVDSTASVQWTPVPVDDEDEEEEEDEEDEEGEHGAEPHDRGRKRVVEAVVVVESEEKEREPEREHDNHNHERRGSSGNGKRDQTGKERREKRWGNVFRVEWIKVQRLPFSQTRHLRNPWNNNREVKVSRDGTELETRVGEKLLQEFTRAEQATQGGQQQQPAQSQSAASQSQGQPQPLPSPQPPAAQAQMVMGVGLFNTPQGLQAMPVPMMQPAVMMWGASPRAGFVAVPPGGLGQGQGPNNGAYAQMPSDYDPSTTPHDPYSQVYPTTTAPTAGPWPYATSSPGQPHYFHPVPPSSPYAYHQTGYGYSQPVVQVMTRLSDVEGPGIEAEGGEAGTG